MVSLIGRWGLKILLGMSIRLTMATYLNCWGEDQDVYIVSHDQQQPLEVFTGKLVAIIRRRDDIEDKWVLAPLDEKVNKGLIAEQTYFMEQYFDSWIEMVEENNDLSKGGYK